MNAHLHRVRSCNVNRKVDPVLRRPANAELRTRELACTHPMAAAHTAPPAKSVTPVMKIAVSNRVIVQLLRMARLNRWIASELAWRRTVNEWLIRFTSAWGRTQGGNTAARDRHDVVSASVLNHLRGRRLQHSLALDAERLPGESYRYRSCLANNAVCRSLVEAPLLGTARVIKRISESPRATQTPSTAGGADTRVSLCSKSFVTLPTAFPISNRNYLHNSQTWLAHAP